MFWRQNSFNENLVVKQTGFLFCFSLIMQDQPILQQVTASLVTINHYQGYKDNQNYLMDNATWEKEWFSSQGLQFNTFHSLFFFLWTAENKSKVPQEAAF